VLYLSAKTILVRIVGRVRPCNTDIRGDSEVHLGHHYDLIARKVVLLDRFAQNYFRKPVRVDVSGVKGLDPKIVAVW
jgi:hypothetical protein